jgi:myo-inositol-1(or 4)-monophosphatase
LFTEYTEFAIEVAKQAGKIVMDFHDRRMEPIWTDRHHFKTAADDASEALIQERIRARYPGHNIYSEEGGMLNKQSRYTWVWDAVDGTMPLFTGLSDHFAVCGALCDGDVPILGVVNAPKRAELYIGEIGGGAYCNGVPIWVSAEIDISRCLMGIDSGKFNRAAHLPFLERAFQPDGICHTVDYLCASMPLVFVARGMLQAYFATSLEPEDMAAAVAIIRAAGGKVTNHAGEEWTIKDPSILTANPVLHAKLGEFFRLF